MPQERRGGLIDAEVEIHRGADRRDSPGAAASGNTGRQLQKAGLVGEGDPWLIASATWATLHGLVMLTLDGQTKGVVPDVDALVDEATRIMMFGMAPRRD